MIDREVGIGEDWQALGDIPATVRYLANVLTEGEGDAFRSFASREAECRKELVRVYAVMERVQAMTMSGVIELASQEDHNGKVAQAWLEIAGESMAASFACNWSRPKVSLADLLRVVQTEAGRLPFVRMIVQSQGGRRPLTPALLRSHSGDFTIGAELTSIGDLMVRITATPQQAKQWEGRELEVCMRAPAPVIVGSGMMRRGQLDLFVPEAGSLLGREAGPIDADDLVVTLLGANPSRFEVLPLAEDDRVGDHPQLAGLPVLQGRKLRATIVLPDSFRAEFAGKQLEIYAGLSPGHWQKLVEFILLKEGSDYTIEAEMPDAPAGSGRVAMAMRYRLSDPVSSGELL